MAEMALVMETACYRGQFRTPTLHDQYLTAKKTREKNADTHTTGNQKNAAKKNADTHTTGKNPTQIREVFL